MGMFTPGYNYSGPTGGGYTVIGGAAYAPGSAAAKYAQQLYNQSLANRQAVAASSPLASPIFTPPSGAAPSSFPSYAPTTGAAGGASGASLAPGPATAGKGAFGLVPSTPNPISTAAGSIAGNQANLPALSKLGTDQTKLAANLAQLPFVQNLPNYLGNLSAAATNVGSNLAGRISDSTANELTRRSAERGVGMGMAPNAPNAQTQWLSALGQTSEQLQGLGQQQLQALIAGTPTGQPFNIAGQQTTPGDVQYWQDVSNVRGAAPDPTQAAQANLDMLLRAIEAGKVAGFPGYGGGGGGSGVLRMPTAPGVMTPGFVGAPYYGGASGGYYSPRITTAPGVSSSSGASASPYYPPSGSIGESAFTPYSLGGYSFGYDPTGASYGEQPQYWPEGLTGEPFQYEPEA